MTMDRFLGAAVAMFGLVLLFYLIPGNVMMFPGQPLDPSLFPRISAWMLILLGTALVLSPQRAAVTPPPWRMTLTGLAIVAAIVAAAAGFSRFGFLPSTIALMAVVVPASNESRPLPLLAIALGLPVAIWALFEFVLLRTLP